MKISTLKNTAAVIVGMTTATLGWWLSGTPFPTHRSPDLIFFLYVNAALGFVGLASYKIFKL